MSQLHHSALGFVQVDLVALAPVLDQVDHFVESYPAINCYDYIISVSKCLYFENFIQLLFYVEFYHKVIDEAGEQLWRETTTLL